MVNDSRQESSMQSSSADKSPAPDEAVAAEPPSERPAQLHDDEAYSIFTVGQKRAILVIASFCAFFSPTTGSIYYPALDVIAHDVHVSNSAINLTVTTYLIFQGLSPMMVGGFSDSAGRRPAYILCFVIFIAANIGLGAQNSYAALIVLRCLQSAGSSGTVSLSNGVVSDMVSSAERGSYIAWASLGALTGPMLGPIIGGLLSQYVGWHWIFWFLAILAGAVFVPLLLFFPETNRKVVGDGSYPPPRICQNLTNMILARRLEKRGVQLDPEKEESLRKNYKIRVPNPLATLVMAADKEGFIVLLSNGLIVANMYAVLTGITSLFGPIYHFNQIQIALCFLPFGAGAIIGSPLTGRLLDHGYRRHATRLGFPVVKNRRQDLDSFPIELARLEIALPMLSLGILVTIAYGWVLHFKTSLAGPLVILFFIGVFTTGGYQAMNALMIDNYPTKAATATAANNLFRCLLGAGATAVLGPMLNAWGPGWTYTFASLLWVVFSPFLMLLVKYGPQWRRQRAEKDKTKKEKRTAAREEKKQARQNVQINVSRV